MMRPDGKAAPGNDFSWSRQVCFALDDGWTFGGCGRFIFLERHDLPRYYSNTCTKCTYHESEFEDLSIRS